MSEEAKFLTVSMATFRENKKALWGWVRSSSGKIIVRAASSQRSKSWSSHLWEHAHCFNL